jgi:hypothetical protein
MLFASFERWSFKGWLIPIRETSKMTNQPTSAGTGAGSGSPKMQNQAQGGDVKQALLKDIRVKWGKFTEQELSGLKNNDDLVSHVIAKYGLEKAQAQRDVDTLRAGRDI